MIHVSDTSTKNTHQSKSLVKYLRGKLSRPYNRSLVFAELSFTLHTFSLSFSTARTISQFGSFKSNWRIPVNISEMFVREKIASAKVN